MRLLTAFLMTLCLLAPSSLSARTPDSPKDMIHLTVRATGVRLRAGAGTEFAIMGMASRNNAGACRFIACAEPGMDSVGMPWFKIIGNVQQQEDLAVFKLDAPCWIRSDFVETRALNQKEAAQVDSTFFRVLDFAPRLLTAFQPAGPIPAFSEERLCFFPQDADKPDVSLPAGESYLLFNTLKGQRTCVGLWRALNDSKIRFAGSVPLEEFLKTDFGADREKVEGWLKKQQTAP
ncbi:MAG: hypothetical protein IJB29_07120 [Mailhella sp.]|nr:hypothetical protein [Mailhella sp.]